MLCIDMTLKKNKKFWITNPQFISQFIICCLFLYEEYVRRVLLDKYIPPIHIKYLPNDITKDKFLIWLTFLMSIQNSHFHSYSTTPWQQAIVLLSHHLSAKAESPWSDRPTHVRTIEKVMSLCYIHKQCTGMKGFVFFSVFFF